MQAYGDAGVEKLIRILEREIVAGMQLLGAKSIADLIPEMVCAHRRLCIRRCNSLVQVERVDWQPVISKL